MLLVLTRSYERDGTSFLLGNVRLKIKKSSEMAEENIDVLSVAVGVVKTISESVMVGYFAVVFEV